MAESLTDDVGLQLLQNAFATAGILAALILALGPASGAHFNPAVIHADRIFGGIDTPTAIGYPELQRSSLRRTAGTSNQSLGIADHFIRQDLRVFDMRRRVSRHGAL